MLNVSPPLPNCNDFHKVFKYDWELLGLALILYCSFITKYVKFELLLLNTGW